MDRREAIRNGATAQISSEELAMRMLVLAPTVAFQGREETGFGIVEECARFLNVSVRSVHCCGSAKLGFSPRSNADFALGSSDLDLAIIDTECFIRCISAVIKETRQFRDRTGFAEGAYRSFSTYTVRGIFRPDFMPDCELARSWTKFFDDISRRHQSVFSKITATVYLSDDSFKMRQAESIDHFIGGYL